MPIPDVPFPSFVLDPARRYGDRTAIVDVSGGPAYTYAELASMAHRAAGGLRALGFQPGDALALLIPNVPEYPVVYHAVGIAGGAAVLTNPLDIVDDLAAHLNESGARFLVVLPSAMKQAAELRARTKVEEIIVLGEAEGATSFASLLAGDPLAAPDIDPAQDVMTILHSSGSTGYPKGVLLTHRNMIANVMQIATTAPCDEDEVVLAVPPFHHAFGIVMALSSSLLQGATIVTMPRFRPEAYLQAIQDHRITRLYIVPTIATLLAKSPLVDQYDLSALRSAVSGGAALDPGIARLASERVGVRIDQGYGLTEGLVSFMQLKDNVSPGSVGRSTPNVECKIVDIDTGNELGPNQDGEILVRGPHVMKGYLNAPQATSAVLEPDGFLHTGDLGHVDDNGELHIVDRLKELIKYNGQQVSPVELEALLCSHPKVVDAAVVGVPDENAIELPKAYVVTREPATAEEIMAFVASRVAPYKKIRRLEFIDQIPRTPVGKIERRSLKSRNNSREVQNGNS